jgi:maltose alpha-D-glucosyltransferase/alpha-amylase
MLRSFSYVQLSAVRQFAHDESQFAKLGALARAWELEARAAFLAAYDEAARDADLYESLDPGSGLLSLFEIEKAFYELRYELGNRPSWAGIPLQAILEWGEAHAKP